MHLLDMLWPARLESQLGAISEEIAVRIKDGVWQRVSGRLPLLGATESRGYIRARAAAAIHLEVGAFLQQDAKLLRHRRQLVRQTQDEVFRLISAHRHAAAPASVPVDVRRAA